MAKRCGKLYADRKSADGCKVLKFMNDEVIIITVIRTLRVGIREIPIKKEVCYLNNRNFVA